MDIDHVIPPTRKLVVHVFAGGFSSPQLSFFLNAINHLSPLISAHGQLRYNSPPTVEYQHVQNMRLLRWTPNDLIDWLLASDIHFILTHPHQGVPRWDVSELHGALQRLRNHPGFPNGTKLNCPVFLQHKFSYLLAIPQFVNPTLAIQFPDVERQDDGNAITFTSNSTEDDFDTPQLRHFLTSKSEGEGWVLKLPFVTMREGLKWCGSFAKVLQELCIATAKFGGRIPYAMIQPRLSNRKEYKVVILNGKASHVIPQCANGVTCPGKAFTFATEITDLFRFAEMAVHCLSKQCPASLTAGLIRVDIMETSAGNLIVNEFESLEAVFEPSGHESGEVGARLREFLLTYWVTVVTQAFEQFTTQIDDYDVHTI